MMQPLFKILFSTAFVTLYLCFAQMSYAAVSITNEIYGTLNPISYDARPNDLS